MTSFFGPDIQLSFNGASVNYEFLDQGSGRNHPGYVTTLRIGVILGDHVSPLPKPLGLVGMGELKRMLGVSRQRAYQLTCSDGFPTPAASLECGKVWIKSEVREWIDNNRP